MKKTDAILRKKSAYGFLRVQTWVANEEDRKEGGGK